MRKARVLYQISIGLIGLFTAALFQNCSYMSSTGSPASGQATSSSQRMNGNGVGYDGKVSYLKKAVSDPCADGSQVQGQIDRVDDQYFLVRESCNDVSQQQIPQNEIDVTKEIADVISYKGNLFGTAAAASASTTMACINLAFQFFETDLIFSGNRGAASFSYNGYNTRSFQVNRTAEASSDVFTGTTSAGDAVHMSIQNKTGFLPGVDGKIHIDFGATYRADHPFSSPSADINVVCF